ncbi:MAG: hypothetical protein ACP5QY_05565, partial [Candidatus Hydrogenedens sp.]
LQLFDETNHLISTNTYWLSATPDIPGVSGHNLKGIFYTRPKSKADFTKLNELEKTKIHIRGEEILKTEKERIFKVHVKNTGSNIAFMLIPELYAPDKPGYELPRVYWSEGGIILRPSEEITIQAKVPLDTLPEKISPLFNVRGWNVEQIQ